MTEHFPITPPPELVQQWQEESLDDPTGAYTQAIANEAAQWGADTELEACCEWLVSKRWFKYEHEAMEFVVEDLRAARRPKPSSLKEQALMALEDGDTGPGASLTSNEVDIIRRALEALPDD